MVTVGTDQSLAYFKLLEQDREKYEANFGAPLKWQERPSKKQKLIKAELPGADPANREDWPRQHAWIHENLNALHATFSSAAKSLDPSDYEPHDDGDE